MLIMNSNSPHKEGFSEESETLFIKWKNRAVCIFFLYNDGESKNNNTFENFVCFSRKEDAKLESIKALRGTQGTSQTLPDFVKMVSYVVEKVSAIYTSFFLNPRIFLYFKSKFFSNINKIL